MGLFGRKPDPISDHERQLQVRLKELEAQIASLNSQIEHEQSQPRLRSTTQPHTPGAAPSNPATHEREEAAFEAVSHQRVTNPFTPAPTTPAREELGVRSRRIRGRLYAWWQQLRGAQARNPTLVRYLAAGNVQGLRPLRYEKRVARNRFLVLLALFILVIYGLFYWSRSLL